MKKLNRLLKQEIDYNSYILTVFKFHDVLNLYLKLHDLIQYFL